MDNLLRIPDSRMTNKCMRKDVSEETWDIPVLDDLIKGQNKQLA